LVDEPQLLERSRELGRSDEDTPLGLRFQRRDRLAKVTLHLDRVLPRKVAPRARHDVLRLRLELLCPLAHRARRLFVACHRGPGSLHQLVGVAPEEHRPALIHELRPIVVQLVVHDPLGVIDARVQSHVETEGEEAHGVGFYEKRAQRDSSVRLDFRHRTESVAHLGKAARPSAAPWNYVPRRPLRERRCPVPFSTSNPIQPPVEPTCNRPSRQPRSAGSLTMTQMRSRPLPVIEGCDTTHSMVCSLPFWPLNSAASTKATRTSTRSS